MLTQQQLDEIRDTDGYAEVGPKENQIEIRELIDHIEEIRDAARSVLWMAKEYAEAGGRGGPEMRDYEAAVAIIGE